MLNLKQQKNLFLAAKSRRKAMKVGDILWTKKTKRKGHSKINEQIKRNVYTLITSNTLVVKSPISNDCLKVMLDDQTEPQLFPKLLLWVSAREPQNILVSDPKYVVLKILGMKMVKLLSVIQHCVRCCHLN